MTEGRGPSKAPLGAFGVLCGVVIGGVAALVPPAFFFILVRKLLVMVAGVLVGYGIAVILTNSFRPLTPTVSWVVPVAVCAGLGGLVLYDLQRIDSIYVVLGPLEGLLLASWCGVPFGSALRRRNATMALVSIGAVVAVLAGTALYWPFSSILFSDFNIALLVAFGGVATAVGYRLTEEESGASSTRTDRAEG